MKGAPRSKRFDDVYFSAEDGLAETRHVFLDGNNLPHAWAGRQRFAIAETGFGTGLNFLAASRLFRQTAAPGQALDYIGIEKFPLTAEEIKEALCPWRDELSADIARLAEAYPALLPGFHRVIIDERITLTLVFDDVNAALPHISGVIDAWFLDGFKPSVNPDMWSETMFSHMARLSRAGTSFATFTAAGFVKRGLRAKGFEVNKIRGFGAKRDMLAGVYQP